MFIIGEVRLSHSFTVATWDRYIVSMALIFLCTGPLHYVPYSSLLISNTFCFSWILDFSECIMFLNRTSVIKKYYAHVL